MKRNPKKRVKYIIDTESVDSLIFLLTISCLINLVSFAIKKEKKKNKDGNRLIKNVI